MSESHTILRLAAGVLRRNDHILMVANSYAGRDDVLWTLPGGRVEPGELLFEALEREFREETKLAIRTGSLLYIAESIDRVADVHVVSATFEAEAEGEPILVDDLHVREVRFVTVDEIRELPMPEVIRGPLLATLTGSTERYYPFADAGVTITFRD